MRSCVLPPVALLSLSIAWIAPQRQTPSRESSKTQTNGWEGHNGRDDPEWASETTRVFRNLTAVSPELTFADVAEQAGLVHRGQGRGVVHLDYDNDGDQDLIIFNNRELPTLVRNELDPDSDGSGRWLRVFLDTAARADLAPDGIGSLVAVHAGDLRQVRYGARRRHKRLPTTILVSLQRVCLRF